MFILNQGKMGEAMDRHVIDEAALRLFRERGYDSVKVQDICDACHITKPTFYHYVPSKDDLLVRYYRTAVDTLSERLGKATDDDCWTQISASYSTLMDASERIGSDLLGRILTINLHENRNSFERRAEITDRMIEIIQAGQERGELANPSDPVQLYEASAYLFQGYELLWCVRKGEFDWRERFMASLEALLRPVRPGGRPS